MFNDLHFQLGFQISKGWKPTSKHFWMSRGMIVREKIIYTWVSFLTHLTVLAVLSKIMVCSLGKCITTYKVLTLKGTWKTIAYLQAIQQALLVHLPIRKSLRLGGYNVEFHTSYWELILFSASLKFHEASGHGPFFYLKE